MEEDDDDDELYMFRADLLSIIRSLNTVLTATGYVECLLARSGWNSIITSLAGSQHNYHTYCCENSIKTPAKHVEFFIKISLRNSASRWLLF